MILIDDVPHSPNKVFNGIPHFQNPNFVPWVHGSTKLNRSICPRMHLLAILSNMKLWALMPPVIRTPSLSKMVHRLRRLGSTVIPRPPFVLSFSARGSQARWRPVVPGIYTNEYFLHYQLVNPEDKWRYSFIDYNWNEHRLLEKVELARDHAMKVLKSAVIFIH